MEDVRIVVVDDQEDARRSLQRLLQLGGYNVWTARDGDEALAVIDARRPHGVLLDLCMPRMDGIELARRIRAARGAGVLIVAVTGSTDPALLTRARAAGADHVLPKPADLVRIEALLPRPRAAWPSGSGLTVSATA